jgi:hypothetical protein
MTGTSTTKFGLGRSSHHRRMGRVRTYNSGRLHLVLVADYACELGVESVS